MCVHTFSFLRICGGFYCFFLCPCPALNIFLPTLYTNFLMEHPSLQNVLLCLECARLLRCSLNLFCMHSLHGFGDTNLLVKVDVSSNSVSFCRSVHLLRRVIFQCLLVLIIFLLVIFQKQISTAIVSFITRMCLKVGLWM